VAAYVCLNAPIFRLDRSEIAAPGTYTGRRSYQLAERADNSTLSRCYSRTNLDNQVYVLLVPTIKDLETTCFTFSIVQSFFSKRTLPSVSTKLPHKQPTISHHAYSQSNNSLAPLLPRSHSSSTPRLQRHWTEEADSVQQRRKQDPEPTSVRPMHRRLRDLFRRRLPALRLLVYHLLLAW
jgi:hypothetical protein